MRREGDLADQGIDLARRLELFPDSTSIERGVPVGCRLKIAGCNLEALAEEHGTPLYLYDRSTMDGAVTAYKSALARGYPGETGLTYAGKAFLCTAIAQWVQSHHLHLDCTGVGELRIAEAAGLPPHQIVLHGVNKSLDDLHAALDRAGVLVVDNRFELHRLAELVQRAADHCPRLWLRLRPGVTVATHRYRQTGQEDSKFGMSLDEAHQAVQFCLEQGYPVAGLHFHLGSHFHDPRPLGPALAVALDLVASLRESTGWLPKVLCTGGGWGVAYHEDELPHPSLERYVQYICDELVSGCSLRRMPLPRLVLEPGRSLVARAGVALYRVGYVKYTSTRRWLLLDGGLADNPRPALYQAAYTALPVNAPDRSSAGPAWLAGPFCESGDVLIASLPMPEVQPGELVAVPVSGAYQLSMGSNYNGARRPAVLLLEAGSARLIQRRETLDDLLRRDVAL